jgi:PAS domain S-box-containing protein
MKKTRAVATHASQPLGGRRWRRLSLPALIVFISVSIFPPISDADEPHPKNVLILYSFSDRNLFDSLDSLKAAIRSRAREPVNFEVEYLETQRLLNADYETSLSETLRQAYSTEKFDTVIVAAYPALQFAVKHRNDIFPDVPIVFSYVFAGRFRDQKLPPGVTGVTVAVDIRGALDLALRLNPDTKNVALIIGNTDFEKHWQEAFHHEFLPFRDKANLIDLGWSPSDQLMKQVSQLPAHTVVFFEVSPQFSAQPVFGTHDALAAIAGEVPTYCVFSAFCMGRGAIGAFYSENAEQTAQTAYLVSRLFEGEKAENIPVLHDSGAHPVVDWRELGRWNIAERAVPAGSLVLFRQPSPWQRVQNYVLGGAALLIIEGFLIFYLLRQTSNKKKAERSLVVSETHLRESSDILQESEERFRRVADTAPVMIWMSGVNKLCTFFNQAWLDFAGRSMEHELGNGWASGVHPEDLDRCLQTYIGAFDVRAHFEMEYRLRRYDGKYRWIIDVGVPRFESSGNFMGYIGSCIDITDRKLTEKSLEELSGRLISGQEAERTRIARDLHDDFSQRLALLGIGLGRLWKKRPESEEDERALIRELWDQTKEISSDVHRLSHQLHSSKLEHVGLGPALKGLCSEISEKYGIQVEFKEEAISSPIAKDVALCLFRIAQEALSNVVKYSQVQRASVELSSLENEIRLRVADAGTGFDPAIEKPDAGIGLVSMRERLRLVGGVLSVRSAPMAGTEILAEVPLVSSTRAPQTRSQIAGG